MKLIKGAPMDAEPLKIAASRVRAECGEEQHMKYSLPKNPYPAIYCVDPKIPIPQPLVLTLFFFQHPRRGYFALCKKIKTLSQWKVLSPKISGRSGSNRQPRPWQGHALPIELRPRKNIMCANSAPLFGDVKLENRFFSRIGRRAVKIRCVYLMSKLVPQKYFY